LCLGLFDNILLLAGGAGSLLETLAYYHVLFVENIYVPIKAGNQINPEPG
jgi:hypothetical protein